MSEKEEIAIIPKGSYVSIMGCRFTLMEDTKVEANQANLDYILKDQKEWYNKPKGDGCARSPKPQTPNGCEGEVMGEGLRARFKQFQEAQKQDPAEISGLSFRQIRPLTRSAKIRLTVALINSGVTDTDDLASSINKIESDIFNG